MKTRVGFRRTGHQSDSFIYFYLYNFLGLTDTSVIIGIFFYLYFYQPVFPPRVKWRLALPHVPILAFVTGDGQLAPR